MEREKVKLLGSSTRKKLERHIVTETKRERASEREKKGKKEKSGSVVDR